MSVEIHRFGAVTLRSGAVLADAFIRFETHGQLNQERSNVVLVLTWFCATHVQAGWLIGADRALDPARLFIIVVNLFGNGQSSSPSDSSLHGTGAGFPLVSILDNVDLQRRLLVERFGIERVALIVGRSMGAQVALQWGAFHPQATKAIIAIEGSARTTPHNQVFLEAVRLALMLDPEWRQGRYHAQPMAGHRLVRTIFDGWAMSQSFYREGLHLSPDMPTTRFFLERKEPEMLGDANDILAQIATWQAADISANPVFGGDLSSALRSIACRTILMPCETDLYFPPEDSIRAASEIPNAEVRVIKSIWGHRAGAPGTPRADVEAIETAVRDTLAASLVHRREYHS